MNKFSKLKAILEQKGAQQKNLSIEEFQKLLNNNEEIDATDLDLVLRKAVQYKVKPFKAFYDMLINKGANVNFADTRDLKTNLMVACENGNQQIVRTLINNQNIDLLKQDSHKATVLFYAVRNKSRQQGYKFIEIILSKYPDLIKRLGNNKKTILIQATEKNRLDLVKLLIKYGADPNEQVSEAGTTALYEACKSLKIKSNQVTRDIIKHLLENQANSKIKNKQGKSVEDLGQKIIEELQTIRQKISKEKKNIHFRLNYQTDFQELLAQAHQFYQQKRIIFDVPNFLEQDIESQQSQDYIESFIDISPMFLDELDQQIQEHAQSCHRDHKNADGQISKFLQDFIKLIEGQNLQVRVYGSFATGLWLKHCDVDLMLVAKDQQINKDYLGIVHQLLVESKKYENINIIINKKIKVPTTIRMQVKESNNKNRKVDITIFDKNHNGQANVKFIQECLYAYPEIRLIFYVIKSLTYHFRLNDPKNGGIRTYAIFLMLFNFRKNYTSINGQIRLSQLLRDFLYYFGFIYQYQYMIFNGQYLMLLNINDPLNHNNNVGNKTNVKALQNMFRVAYYGLHANISGKRLNYLFDLKKIFV